MIHFQQCIYKMKSQTKHLKAQRRTSVKRLEVDRCGDDNGANDKNDTYTSLKGKKERMSSRNPYSPMVPLKRVDDIKQPSKKYLKQADELLNMSDTELMARSMMAKDKEFKVGSWDDILDKPFEIMLTQDLADRIGLPLKIKDGIWWIQVPALKERNSKCK